MSCTVCVINVTDLQSGNCLDSCLFVEKININYKLFLIQRIIILIKLQIGIMKIKNL